MGRAGEVERSLVQPAKVTSVRSAREAQRNLAWVKPDALVFSTMRGNPQSRRNLLRAVQTAGTNIGVNGDGVEPVGLHDLRHSFVAVAFAKGLSAPEIAARMGLCGATVRFWLNRFNARGLQGLAKDMRSGRPPTRLPRRRCTIAGRCRSRR